MQYKPTTRKQNINMISTIEIDILVTIRTNESIQYSTHGINILNQMNKYREQFDIPKISFGSLYPTLHRMEQKNLICVDTKQINTESYRSRQIYYRLTELGNDYLNRVLCYRAKLLEN